MGHSSLDSLTDSISDEVSMGHSCYKEDSDIVVKKINFKYKQKDVIKGNVSSFILFNSIYLFCLITLHHKKRPKFRLDLTFFDPNPSRYFSIAWKSLIASVLLLLMAVFIPGDLIAPFSSLFDLSYLPVLFGIAGFCLLLFAYFKSYSRIVFRSYASRVPLLVLSYKPTQKNYKKFISALQKGIVLAHKQDGITLQDRLVGEMKDLRRLKDCGVISERIYNKAQSAILTHKYYK